MRAGFTLVEVLVAVSILTGALASAAFLLASAFSTYRNQNKRLEVNHLVHDQLEVLSNTPYEVLKGRMKKARQVSDPPRLDVPPQEDFTSNSGGEAQVDYSLDPPQGDAIDYTVKRKVQGNQTLAFQSGPQADGGVDANLHLQYWDPVFDGPSITDRGLIRAAFHVKAGAVNDQAVKYLSR